MSGCQRNMADPSEDGPRLGQIAYRPCGEPAPWTIDGRWVACDKHAHEALMDGCDGEGPGSETAEKRADDDSDYDDDRRDRALAWSEGPR